MTDSDFASITQDGKLCDAEGQMGQARRREMGLGGPGSETKACDRVCVMHRPLDARQKTDARIETRECELLPAARVDEPAGPLSHGNHTH